MFWRCHSLCILGLFAAGVSTNVASAQDSSDTSALIGRHYVAVWASAGIGSGSVSGASHGPAAGVLRAQLSVRSYLVAYRGTDIGPVHQAGDGVRDAAVLAGVRTAGRRVFGSAALGYGRANHYRQGGENSGAEQVDPSVGTLAYDVAAHANYGIAGMAVCLSGNVAPAPIRYSALTLAFEFGWFGR